MEGTVQRRIKSFTLRAGRLSPRQARGLNESLTQYALPMQLTPWDLRAHFNREAKTVVEIGFGMGQSLVEMAKANPDTNFIGIEVHKAGIGSLVADVEDEKLTNVRVAPMDAVEVFKHCIAPNSLHGIQVFFPDPWPKARHNKRRLIQAEFVKILANALTQDGYLHCATDWEDYAYQMLQVLSNEEMLKNEAVSNGFVARPDTRPLTRFEARGMRLGHGVWDLMFRRQ